MNDSVREKLRELVIKYGTSLCDDPKRCEALLKDFCGQSQREIHILTIAAKDGIPSELLSMNDEIPFEVWFSRYSKRLHDKYGISEEFADWAVTSWAWALNKTEVNFGNHTGNTLNGLNKKLPSPPEDEHGQVKNQNKITMATVQVSNSKNTYISGLLWLATLIGLISVITGYIGRTVGPLLLGDFSGLFSETSVIFNVSILLIYYYKHKVLTPLRITIDLVIIVLFEVVCSYLRLVMNESMGFLEWWGLIILGSLIFNGIYGVFFHFRIKNIHPLVMVAGSLLTNFIFYAIYRLWGFYQTYQIIESLTLFLSGFIVIFLSGIFKKAWLEMAYDNGKQSFVHLGWFPVKVSNNKQKSDVFIDSPSPLNLQYSWKNRQILLRDMITGQERPVQSGEEIIIDNTTIVAKII